MPVVYVELKPGETVSAETLKAFADQRIMERAARSKAGRIVPALPLTAIGKVFKPAEANARKLADSEPRVTPVQSAIAIYPGFHAPICHP